MLANLIITMKLVSLQMLYSFCMGKKIKAKNMGGGSQKLWNYSPLNVMHFIYLKFDFLTMFYENFIYQLYHNSQK